MENVVLPQYLYVSLSIYILIYRYNNTVSFNNENKRKDKLNTTSK